ncbi:hypothetical protein WJX84_011478 [Apatococcus fuscideae]|uniref:Flavodoxin-like domain-containing protein n=1 Tax=Apatococcus fuscideae TaxID=2026836 RepID=A0AAW1TGP6_9CHLO
MWLEDLLQIWLALQQILRKLYSLYVKTAPHKCSIPELRPAHKQPAACGKILEKLVLLIVSTYEDGKPPNAAKWFCQWLEESSSDFRVGSEALHKLSYGVFGSGNSLYEDNYNKVARAADDQLGKLGAHRLGACGLGDEFLGSPAGSGCRS